MRTVLVDGGWHWRGIGRVENWMNEESATCPLCRSPWLRIVTPIHRRSLLVSDVTGRWLRPPILRVRHARSHVKNQRRRREIRPGRRDDTSCWQVRVRRRFHLSTSAAIDAMASHSCQRRRVALASRRVARPALDGHALLQPISEARRWVTWRHWLLGAAAA